MPQPNILLITTDQQRYDSVGPKAPACMRAPHFDWLSRDGITFPTAYSDCPICVATRVSIMTGKHTFTHGEQGNGQTTKRFGREGTLPTRLRELGYQTAAIGKMHFGPQRARHGFDEMILPDDYYRAMQRSGNPLQPMRHGLGQTEIYPTMATVPEALTLTNWIAEQCVEYVRVRRDPTAPFFLWCSFSKPHPPFDPPEPYYSMYRHASLPEAECGEWSLGSTCPEAIRREQHKWSLDLMSSEIIREARSAYLGLITQCDYNMGRIFCALHDMKLFDDTLILFTSDHGEYLGDHRLAHKTYFHEPSAHVPFVLRLPQCWDKRMVGTVVNAPITHADILPTLVHAGGGAVRDDVDGQDLIALARGDLDTPRKFVVGTCKDFAYLGLVDNEWKYIWYSEGPAEQLFHIKTDPKEMCDLSYSPEHLLQKKQLREALHAWLLRHAPHVLRDGQLPQKPAQQDSIQERRCRLWLGLHTEWHTSDVRH